MFFGEKRFFGAPISFFTSVIVSCITIAFCATECQFPKSKLLKIFHCILGYPTIQESIIVLFISWACRNVERILGTKQFSLLLGINIVFLAILLLLSSLIVGVTTKITLMLFYPYTVFIFTLAHIPASPLFIYLTDKFLSSLVFILLFLIGFPNSLIILFSSIAGNIFWSYDLFHISKFIETPKLPDEENLISSHEQDTITNDLQTLIAMGFDEKLAEQALTASNNDLETAIAILLNGH